MLERIRNKLTPHCAHIVYISFVQPIPDYCGTVWNSCGSGSGKNWEKLQRRTARIVTGIQYSDRALE